MATAGALPSAPFGMGINPESQQQYTDALDQALKAAEGRQNTNWFSVAGQFLDPGKTGSFGEALGHASSDLGKQQENQEAKALPIAQMRAQIAGQKFEMVKDATALNALSQLVGVPGPAALQMLASGEASMNPAMMSRLAMAYPAFATSPKIAEVVKNSFMMYQELQKNIMEEKKLGRTDAELVAKFGRGILPMLQGTQVQGDRLPQVGGVASPSTTPAQPQGPITPPNPDRIPVGTPSQGAEPDYEGMGDRGETPSPKQFPGVDPEASMATQQEIIKEREKAALESASKRRTEREAEYKPLRTAIVGFDPVTTDKIDRNSRELVKIAGRSPQVFGVLKQDPGIKTAVGTAMEEGVRIGDFGAISLPVTKVLLAMVPVEQQNDLIRARQLLAENFFANSMANKAAMPGQISNYEEKLLAAPLSGLEDTAQSVQEYAQRAMVMNAHRRELNASFKEYEHSHPTATLHSYFVDKNSPYQRINQKYATLAAQLSGSQ